jgi:hypothetical protein
VLCAGEAIKALINEEFGDGIMSAIGFYATVDKMTGNEGEARVVITFNGEPTAPQVTQVQQLSPYSVQRSHRTHPVFGSALLLHQILLD